MADHGRVTLASYQVILAGPANWMKKDPLIITAAHAPWCRFGERAKANVSCLRENPRRKWKQTIISDG